MGEIFHKWPWEVEDADYDRVMRYWELIQIKRTQQQKAEEDRQEQAARAREMAEQPDLE
jgi:hypothetical protein